LARRSSGEGGLRDVKRAAQARIYFSIAHGVADPPFKLRLGVRSMLKLMPESFRAKLASPTEWPIHLLPVQKFSKKVKKKLASFREVQ
jgi:hypothetical protein